MTTFLRGNNRAFNLAAICVIGFTLLLSYSNTFSSPFYFDDYGYVIGNSYVEISDLSWSSLKDAALKTPGKTRAFGNITFALNHYFFGSGVLSFHVANFLIHLCASWAVFFLFIKTLELLDINKGRNGLALLASLIWAVHPLHINSVTYIVQRLNSLAGCLCVLCLLGYVYGRTVQNRLKQFFFFFCSLLFGIAAVSSKENALMLPAMLAAYELYFLSNLSDKKKKIVLLSLCGGLIFFVAGFVLLIHNGDFLFFLSGYAKKEFTLGQRLLTEGRVVFFYLSLFFLPLPGRFNVLHDFSLSTGFFTPPQTFIALLAFLFLCGAIAWLYKKNRLASFAVLWFLGNLVIESTIIPLALIFEHRTYLPTVFLPLVFLMVGRNVLKKPLIYRTVGTMLIPLLIFCTWQRNQVWTNTLSFWSDIAEKSPNISRGHLGVFFALKRQGDEKSARASLLRGFTADPTDEKVMTNLVNIYMEEKNFRKVIEVLNTFLARRKSVNAFINRAKAHAMLKQYDQVVRDTKEAIKINPKSGLAWLIQGKALSTLGQRNKALKALNLAQGTGLSSALLSSAIGEVYINAGQVDLAIHYFQEAITIDPNHASSHYYLGLAYGRKGLKEKAKKEMEKGMYLRNNPPKIQRANPHNF